jgi:hypothetical protein
MPTSEAAALSRDVPELLSASDSPGQKEAVRRVSTSGAELLQMWRAESAIFKRDVRVGYIFGSIWVQSV